MTIACGVIIFILFLGEYLDYRSVHVESSLIVDTGRKEKMDIELDITFPKIPCYSNDNTSFQYPIIGNRHADHLFGLLFLGIVLTLDVMDVAGEHQNDIEHSVYKIQLSSEGVELYREKAVGMHLTSLYTMHLCISLIRIVWAIDI